MFKSLATLALALTISVTSKADNKTIILTEKNTIVLRDLIDEQSVAQVQDKAIRLSHTLPANSTIYLFLDTPGGDIRSGSTLITTLKGLPQRVDTITNFAASMGFITVQSLGRRYVLPTGTLMSHRARGGMTGQIPGELNSRLSFFTGVLDVQDAVIAGRLKLSKKEYQNLIVNEYWTYGSNAVANNVADEVVNVRCDKALSEGRTAQTLETFFGPIQLVYSNCPLINTPLEVKFEQVRTNDDNVDGHSVPQTVRRMVLSLAFDKINFYENYVVTNEYKKVFP